MYIQAGVLRKKTGFLSKLEALKWTFSMHPAAIAMFSACLLISGIAPGISWHMGHELLRAASELGQEQKSLLIVFSGKNSVIRAFLPFIQFHLPVMAEISG